jgi:hypothetical protein
MKAINLKIIFLIIFSIIVFFYFFYSSKNLDNLETELKNFDKGTSTNITEISNPVFKSKGLETNSYTIKADKGIQEEDFLKLYNLKAELEGKNNKVFYVSADKGLYDQLNETIKLSGNVIILDELKNKTTTKKALIEIERKKITLLEEVVSISANSYISSNSSIVDEINNTVTYTGDVKVKIENE